MKVPEVFMGLSLAPFLLAAEVLHPGFVVDVFWGVVGHNELRAPRH
jgi:hypothetical protein